MHDDDRHPHRLSRDMRAYLKLQVPVGAALTVVLAMIGGA